MSTITCVPHSGDVVLGLHIDRANYFRARESMHEAMAEALVATFKSVAGREPSVRLQEALYDALQGEV